MENADYQRILKVMQVKQIPSFAQFSRLIGLPTPQNFTDLKRGKYKITRNFASKIHDVYPDISTAWLMTGEGGMYVGGSDNHGDIHHNNVSGDLLGNGASKREAPDIASVIISQQQTIERLTKIIETLTSKQ